MDVDSPSEDNTQLRLSKRPRQTTVDRSSRATSITLVDIPLKGREADSLDLHQLAEESWSTHLATAARLKETDDTFFTPETRATRFGYDLPLYLKIVESAVQPQIYTYETYQQALLQEPPPFDSQRACYMICTKEEATELFRRGKPLINVKVPKLRAPRIALDGPGQFLDKIQGFPTVAVHLFDKAKDASPSYLETVNLPPGKVVEMMRADTPVPINLLDLDALVQNPVPECIADVWEWSFLTNVKDTKHAGKQTSTYVSDLSAGAAFHVCGKAGSFSLPHMDNHGVDTTIVVEDGKKLWYTFARMTDDERLQWGSSDDDEDWAPPVPCFPVLLEPGDFWYQTSGTVHAPYSVTSCLITGTKHWHSAHMLPVIQQSLFERHHPSVTNEAEAQESFRKFLLVEELWKSNTPAWQWGSAEDLAEFSRLLHDVRSRPTEHTGLQ